MIWKNFKKSTFWGAMPRPELSENLPLGSDVSITMIRLLSITISETINRFNRLRLRLMKRLIDWIDYDYD
jgi:hypothetical protein